MKLIIGKSDIALPLCNASSASDANQDLRMLGQCWIASTLCSRLTTHDILPWQQIYVAINSERMDGSLSARVEQKVAKKKKRNELNLN